MKVILMPENWQRVETKEDEEYKCFRLAKFSVAAPCGRRRESQTASIGAKAQLRPARLRSPIGATFRLHCPHLYPGCSGSPDDPISALQVQSGCSLHVYMLLTTVPDFVVYKSFLSYYGLAYLQWEPRIHTVHGEFAHQIYFRYSTNTWKACQTRLHFQTGNRTRLRGLFVSNAIITAIRRKKLVL